MTQEWRRRIRTIAFKPHIWNFINKASKQLLNVNLNLFVNRLLEKAIELDLPGPIGERIKQEFTRDQLLAEERQLRRELTAILRSGAFLQDYAEELLLGRPQEIARIRNRTGVYARVDTKELDVILRILQRREDLTKELVTIESLLLPKNRYPLALSDKGWKIGPTSRSRGRMTNKKPEREEERENAVA